MILTHFIYDKVSIAYDEPVPDHSGKSKSEEIWRNAQIHFKRDGDITTLEIHGGRDRFILLGGAKVIELTPWGAKFEAYWWQTHPIRYNKDGRLSKRQKRGFKRRIRADIVCEF